MKPCLLNCKRKRLLFFKKNVIYCPSGLSASAVPAKVRKNPKVVAQQRAPQQRPAMPAGGRGKPTAKPSSAGRGVAAGPPGRLPPGAPGGPTGYQPSPATGPPVSGIAKPPAGAVPMPFPGGAKGKPAGKPVAKVAGQSNADRPLPAAGGLKPSGQSKPAAGRALPQPAATPKIQYRALYDYDAVEADELTFREGDAIILTKKVDNDWWEGQLGGKIGMFPSNYVEKV